MLFEKLNLSGQTKGIIYGLLSAVFVSGYVLVNKHIYDAYQPTAFDYTVTFALAGAVFAGVSLAFRQARAGIHLKPSDMTPLLTIGLLGGLAMALIVFGQRYTTAVNASILITATVITTNIFSKIILKDSFSRRQQLWVAVMFVGLYLGIVGLHTIHFNLGDCIILSASIVFGFTNTFSKLVIHKHDGKLVADVRLVASGLALAIVGLAAVGSQVLVTSAGLWPLAAGLCFWLGIRTFYGSVHHLSPNKAFVLNNSQLFFTAVIGVLVLSEPYGWSTFIGSVIVLASIYFITKK